MGVAIQGYVSKRRVDCDVPARMWCDRPEHSRLYNLRQFEKRAGLIPLYADDEVARYGCFDLGEGRQIMRLSYSGYNRWRAQLCRAVCDVAPETVWDDIERFIDQPFYELVTFADNEGTLGGDTLKRLLAAFDEHAERLTVAGVEHVDDWRRVLRAVVAGDGVVVFS